MEEFVLCYESFIIGCIVFALVLLLTILIYHFIDLFIKYLHFRRENYLSEQLDYFQKQNTSKESMIKMLEHYRLDYLDLSVKYDTLKEHLGVNKNEKRTKREK